DDDLGRWSILEGVVGNNRQPAAGMDRLGCFRDRVKLEKRVHSARNVGVLEDFPRPGEVDDDGPLGEQKGDRNASLGGGLEGSRLVDRRASGWGLGCCTLAGSREQPPESR